MTRYVVLLKFTEKGIGNIKKSTDREHAFKDAVKAEGVKLESVFWTVGPYDGVVVISAPDEHTAAGVILGLGANGNVTTCMLRAFEEDEFKKVVEKMP